jgi:hypothetical protein
MTLNEWEAGIEPADYRASKGFAKVRETKGKRLLYRLA